MHTHKGINSASSYKEIRRPASAAAVKNIQAAKIDWKQSEKKKKNFFQKIQSIESRPNGFPHVVHKQQQQQSKDVV